MKNIRIIPKLDIKGPNLIKSIQFDGHRVLGTADQFAEIYYKEGADELIYQDTVASLYQRNSLKKIISATAEKVFIPITVAGGIRSLDDMKSLLRAGADKIAINTAAVENIDLIQNGAKKFGSSCIVSSLEVFKQKNGKYEIWKDFGRERTLIDAIEWSKRVVDSGAGEILLTSIDREGTGEGYDLELIDTIASSVTVPVIASGGAGKKEHIKEVVSLGNADAVSAASLFHYNYWKLIDRKKLVIYKNELRMGKHIDIGNIDFLMNGYGGNQDILVDPISIKEAKNMVFSKGNENVSII